MSKVQTLRALVNERLAAAAEEISALFERATAEYEEELCLSEDENQRTQRLLDQALSRRVLKNQGLNQDFTETAWIKEEPEEQSVSQEEEQLPVSVPESGAVRVKTEESSEPQQRQTEHRKETQGEDISSETHFHSETEGHTDHSSDTDNDDDWEPPFSCSAVHMDEDKSRPDGAEREKHQCPFCTKGFRSNWFLQRHIRVHTGERPYSCSTCSKALVNKSDLTKHVRSHTGERPYSCSACSKAFASKSDLIRHLRTHTGKRPYSCSTCNKAFARKDSLNSHTATHTRERDHSRVHPLVKCLPTNISLNHMSAQEQDKAQSLTEGNIFKVCCFRSQEHLQVVTLQ